MTAKGWFVATLVAGGAVFAVKTTGGCLNKPAPDQRLAGRACFEMARTLAKTATVYGCSLAFGRPHKQALSTGLLLVPMAGLAIGLVQTTATH